MSVSAAVGTKRRVPVHGGGIMSASARKVLATHGARKAIVLIAAALLLAAASAWAMTGGSVEFVSGGGHYSLQPVW